MATELRGTLRWRVRILFRDAIRLLMKVTPSRPHVVISGMPTTEGNATEMVRATARRYAGRVYWLVPDVSVARQLLLDDDLKGAGNVTVLAHRSSKAILRVVTAEVLMFTHGVFGNPAPVGRKTMVNLWHGGGIKGNLMAFEDGEPIIRSDYLVAATARIGAILARQSRVRDDHLLVLGNPRVALFARPVGPDALARLGIPSDRPFVVWMPTYRHNRGQGLVAGWSEVGAEPSRLNATMESGVEALARQGLTVVVKPHPQDAESRRVSGAHVISNEDLAAAGVHLYQLLGASAGLLTDYSSVWIDYLGLDRTIGFVVPDVEAYAGQRGFDPPDALDWLPGERVSTIDAFVDFAEDVSEGGARTRQRRADVAQHWGHVFFPDAPDRILDELDRRGIFNGRLRPRETTGTLP